MVKTAGKGESITRNTQVVPVGSLYSINTPKIGLE